MLFQGNINKYNTGSQKRKSHETFFGGKYIDTAHCWNVAGVVWLIFDGRNRKISAHRDEN